jgi:hypothetical protein
MYGAVQGYDSLASARGTGHPCRANVVAFHKIPLFGMKENCPLFPRKFERARQFLDICHDAEPALRVGMFEWIRRRRDWWRDAWFAASG